jgi:hypothetical protein
MTAGVVAVAGLARPDGVLELAPLELADEEVMVELVADFDFELPHVASVIASTVAAAITVIARTA